MAVVQKEAIVNFGSDGLPASITIDGRTYTGFAAALGAAISCQECALTKTPGSRIFTIEIAEGGRSTTLPAYTLFHPLKGRVSVSSHT